MRFVSPTSLRRILAVLAISALTALGITLVAPTAGAQEPSGGWFAVSPIEPPDHMWGMEWLPDSEVHVDIDDPDVVGTVDFTTNIPTDGDGRFEVYDLPFDIEAGQIVTVSQGDYVKTHEVIDLTITEIDPTADTVSGVGAADALTYVNGPEGQVVVTSGETGVWTADLGGAGIDIVPGTTIYVFQADEDWDQTQIDAHLPEPFFSVSPIEPPDHMWGLGWLPDSDVQVDIDDPAMAGTVDFTTNIPTDAEGHFEVFDLPFDIQAGQIVTVSQGDVSQGEYVKTHDVIDLTITDIDPTADTVSGVGAADSLTYVNGPEGQVIVTADGSGLWTADLGSAGIDIVLGTTIYVFQADEDGDQTQIDAHVETPGASIQVVPVDDHVDLIGFAPGAVTVTINGTALDPAPDGGSGDEGVSLADYGIDLVAGDVVIASQNGSIAEVTTVHVEITAVDSTTGVVSGLAPDGALVNVEAWTDNGSAERVTTANGGAFSVDFSLPGGPSDPNPDVVTLTPGSAVTAFVYDVPHTGDASKHGWQVPEVSYDFIGFGDPVDNEAVNLVTAGRTVPLKFRITTGAGDPVTDLADVSVTVTTLQCELGTTTDQVEEYAAGNSGLQNLGDGYYQYNWKTPKSYKNSCKLLTLDIGDGVAHTADFHFIR